MCLCEKSLGQYVRARKMLKLFAIRVLERVKGRYSSMGKINKIAGCDCSKCSSRALCIDPDKSQPQTFVNVCFPDVALEYDDTERLQHYRDFYNDVLPELRSVGSVVQFKACCNSEPHLRGNVYVQFKRSVGLEVVYLREFLGRMARWPKNICENKHFSASIILQGNWCWGRTGQVQ